MGTTELAAAMAERSGLTARDARAALDAALAEISARLAAGERVTITGFGTFAPAPRAARTTRNPRTGATIEVPPTTSARFTPGAGLKAAVAAGVPVAAEGMSSVIRRHAPVQADASASKAATPAAAKDGKKGKDGKKAAKGKKGGKGKKG